MNDLYIDFTNEYPDFAPKSKMTISRIRFNKWIASYSQFKYECDMLEGRDKIGKWIQFVNKSYYDKQSKINL